MMMSHIDEEALRSIDIAGDEPNERRRAKKLALRESVLAESAPPTAHLAPRRRRLRVARVSAIVTAGVAVAAVVTLLPGIMGSGDGGKPGGGGGGSVWAAVSEPLTPELQAQAAEACGESEEWWKDPAIGPFDPEPIPESPIADRVRLADKRGDRIQLVISHGEVRDYSHSDKTVELLQACTYVIDTDKAIAGQDFRRAATADFGWSPFGSGSFFEVGGTWGEIGQVRDDVASMTATHLGVEMEVKIEDGLFSLWWPEGSVAELETLHWEDPKAAVVYETTFADGRTETSTNPPWILDEAINPNEVVPDVNAGGTAWADGDSEPLRPDLAAEAAEECVAAPDAPGWEGDGSPSPAERIVLGDKRGDLVFLILTITDYAEGYRVEVDCTYNVDSGVVRWSGETMARGVTEDWSYGPIIWSDFSHDDTQLLMGAVREDVVAVTVNETGTSIDAVVMNGHFSVAYRYTDVMKQELADRLKMTEEEIDADPDHLFREFEVTLQDGTVLIGGIGPWGMKWNEKE